MSVSRTQVLRYRVHAQQLDRPTIEDRAPDDATILDLGVQDTGPDGALWSLAVRGVPVRAKQWPDELALAWTVRVSPHAYRRQDLTAVEKALRPWSEADAAKRVITASGPLAAAGIPVLDALATVSRTMHDVVDEPMVKGTLSTRMTAEVTEPYLRWCAGCHATHMYESLFRLAALHAGVELEPDTSPPVLRRIPGWPASQVGRLERARDQDDGQVDLLRGLLHLLGPLTPKQAAVFLDSTVRDVQARWPEDAVEVDVDGTRAGILDADLAALRDPPTEPLVRLLGPYDLYLQGRDRELVVPDKARHKGLWPTLGRPGAVLADGEIVGTWRPRAKGKTLALELDEWVPWTRRTRAAVER